MARLTCAVGFPEKREPEILYIGPAKDEALAAIDSALEAGDIIRGELYRNMVPSKRVNSTSIQTETIARQKRSDAINAEAKKRVAAYIEGYKKDPMNSGKAPSLELQRKAMGKAMADLEASTPMPAAAKEAAAKEAAAKEAAAKEAAAKEAAAKEAAAKEAAAKEAAAKEAAAKEAAAKEAAAKEAAAKEAAAKEAKDKK